MKLFPWIFRQLRTKPVISIIIILTMVAIIIITIGAALFLIIPYFQRKAAGTLKPDEKVSRYSTIGALYNAMKRMIETDRFISKFLKTEEKFEYILLIKHIIGTKVHKYSEGKINLDVYMEYIKLITSEKIKDLIIIIKNIIQLIEVNFDENENFNKAVLTDKLGIKIDDNLRKIISILRKLLHITHDPDGKSKLISLGIVNTYKYTGLLEISGGVKLDEIQYFEEIREEIQKILLMYGKGCMMLINKINNIRIKYTDVKINYNTIDVFGSKKNIEISDEFNRDLKDLDLSTYNINYKDTINIFKKIIKKNHHNKFRIGMKMDDIAEIKLKKFKSTKEFELQEFELEGSLELEKLPSVVKNEGPRKRKGIKRRKKTRG